MAEKLVAADLSRLGYSNAGLALHLYKPCIYKYIYTHIYIYECMCDISGSS